MNYLYMCYTIIYQIGSTNIHMTMFVYPHPHARKSARLHAHTHARSKHSTLKSKFVNAKILSCARPHARTMQSYKACLLYLNFSNRVFNNQGVPSSFPIEVNKHHFSVYP